MRLLETNYNTDATNVLNDVINYYQFKISIVKQKIIIKISINKQFQKRDKKIIVVIANSLILKNKCINKN